jgi:hypothetical protein
MTDTNDHGKFFWYRTKLRKGAPFMFRSDGTFEVDPPYRYARSIVIQYWPGKGIVLGKWNDNPDPLEDPQVSLMRALGATPTDDFDPDPEGAEGQVAALSKLNYQHRPIKTISEPVRQTVWYRKPPKKPPYQHPYQEGPYDTYYDKISREREQDL